MCHQIITFIVKFPFFQSLAYRNLKYHISVIHEKNPNRKTKDEESLKCNTCDKMFKGKTLLLQHQKTHEDRKLSQVQCDICKNWLKNRYILTTHKKLHNQTPKKCPHCNKIKPNEQALKSHISTVHATPKHKCTICSKSFTRPKSLKVCVLILSSITRKLCSLCILSFSGTYDDSHRKTTIQLFILRANIYKKCEHLQTHEKIPFAPMESRSC